MCRGRPPQGPARHRGGHQLRSGEGRDRHGTGDDPVVAPAGGELAEVEAEQHHAVQDEADDEEGKRGPHQPGQPVGGGHGGGEDDDGLGGHAHQIGGARHPALPVADDVGHQQRPEEHAEAEQRHRHGLMSEQGEAGAQDRRRGDGGQRGRGVDLAVPAVPFGQQVPDEDGGEEEPDHQREDEQRQRRPLDAEQVQSDGEHGGGHDHGSRGGRQTVGPDRPAGLTASDCAVRHGAAPSVHERRTSPRPRS